MFLCSSFFVFVLSYLNEGWFWARDSEKIVEILPGACSIPIVGSSCSLNQIFPRKI